MRFASILLFLLFNTSIAYSQIERLQRVDPNIGGTTQNADFNTQSNNSTQFKKASIALYKRFNVEGDSTVVDTSLRITRDYALNYLRRDRFELLPFANTGQVHTPLGYTFTKQDILPGFVASAQQILFQEAAEVPYYRVPTPLSEVYFRSAFEQGQQLDAFFTVNTSEQFNFYMRYKGLRSLGKFQNALASNGTFTFSTNYQSKDTRYKLKTHFVGQDYLNQQNGGLTAEALALFIDNEQEFSDRGRLEVNFEDAENYLQGNRFFVNQTYALISQIDSTAVKQLQVGQTYQYDFKRYEYRQTTPFAAFGDAFTTSIADYVTLKTHNISGFVQYQDSKLGSLKGAINYNQFLYGQNRLFVSNSQTIPNAISGHVWQLTGSYSNSFKGFSLKANGALNIEGQYTGSLLEGVLGFDFSETHRLEAGVQWKATAPDFIFQLYQSDYINYNWRNNFSNIQSQNLFAKWQHKWFGELYFNYTGITNYAYLGIPDNNTNNLVFTPQALQFSGRLDYIKLRWKKQFSYGKWRLYNTVQLQEVLQGKEVLPLPQLITRNSLYYEDYWFSKALFLQTGVTFNYFTAFKSPAYDPVLGAFYVQDSQEIGGFPVLDVFFNARVKQTRIYLKYAFINQLFSQTNNYFSAPGYPYRDALLRFGLVWNFFL